MYSNHKTVYTYNHISLLYMHPKISNLHGPAGGSKSISTLQGAVAVRYRILQNGLYL